MAFPDKMRRGAQAKLKADSAAFGRYKRDERRTVRR